MATNFPKDLIDEANEILCDSSLNYFEKHDELSELLLDWGYDLDDTFDLLLALR